MPQLLANGVLIGYLVLGGSPPEQLTSPEALGFVSVRICLTSDATRDLFAGFALINPHAINGVANPPLSPEGCVRIFIGGRTIYVIGTEEILAAKIAKALRERGELGREQ